jgi:outer membrane immunogenic protein
LPQHRAEAAKRLQKNTVALPFAGLLRIFCTDQYFSEQMEFSPCALYARMPLSTGEGITMRRIFLASIVALLAPIGTAAAAGAPAYDWSGIYIGLNYGVAVTSGHWNNSNDPNAVPYNQPFDFSSQDSGFIAGGQIGINKQFDNVIPGYGLVLGLEGAVDGADINGQTAVPAVNALLQTKQNRLESVVAHFGIAADRLLLYASAGAAFTSYHFYDIDHSSAGTYSDTYPASSRTGWTAGLGLDYAVFGNWIVGFDWKYADFGTRNVASGYLTGSGPPAGPGFDLIAVRETENTIMARFSYKFAGFP